MKEHPDLKYLKLTKYKDIFDRDKIIIKSRIVIPTEAKKFLERLNKIYETKSIVKFKFRMYFNKKLHDGSFIWDSDYGFRKVEES